MPRTSTAAHLFDSNPAIQNPWRINVGQIALYFPWFLHGMFDGIHRTFLN